MKFDNIFFVNETAYAGKSTMVKRLAEKYEKLDGSMQIRSMEYEGEM